MVYNIFRGFHSGWAYLTLLMGVLFFVVILFYLLNKRKRDDFVKKLSMFTVITFHIQLVTGAILYIFLSPKVEDSLVLYKYEHPVLMLAAVFLITVAFAKLKREKNIQKDVVIMTAVALICMFIRIPWQDWSS